MVTVASDSKFKSLLFFPITVTDHYHSKMGDKCR